MNKFLYFSALFSVVFAAFFIFLVQPEIIVEDDNSLVRYSETIRSELGFLARTLNSFSGTEDSLQMKELILLSGITIKKNVDSMIPSCDDAVALKIGDFTLKVMEGIGALSNIDVTPEEAEILSLQLKKNAGVLTSIVELALDKYSDKIVQGTESQVERLFENYRYLLIFFLVLCVFMTGFAFFQESRLKNETKKAINELKGFNEKELQEIQRKLIREQMLGERKDVLLDTIPAGLFSCDSKGFITLTNSKIKSWFDVDRDISGEDVKTVFSKMGIDQGHREKFTHKGDVFWISGHKFSNELFYVVTNITQQEDMSRKLLDSERLVSIGEMASRITHEIRNPLSTVKLNSEYMVENIDKLDESEMLSSLSLIVHEVERLETITDKYMDMVRYRNSEETEKFTDLPVDLVQFSSFHSSELQKRNIEITTRVDSKCELSITLSSFKEIMLNLYKNAWEELKNGGRIRVEAVLESPMVKITVEDSGGGIPEDERERVFKNFYTKKPGGTGIGLSHSKKLAEEAGGSLEIEDSNLGGARMVLKVPLKG